MQAEMENRPFAYTGSDPHLALQAAIFAQRQSEYNFKLEGYRQKADSLSAQVAKARSDVVGYRDRLSVAINLEKMRNELDRLGVGSKLNTLSAQDTRAEMQRNLDSVEQAGNGAQRDLAAMIAERNGYIQSWHADIAEKLAEAAAKLSDARESFNKAQLRRQLVELRADQDATVLDGRQRYLGRVGAERRPAVHHPRAGECAAGNRGEHSRQRGRLCSCRRHRGDQVRYIPVYAIRHGAWCRPDHQPRQLQRAG